MADKERTFTKEELKLVWNFGKKLVSEQMNKIMAEAKNRFDPNVRFANTLKAKYNALVAAGFSEKQAFELALKAVEEPLKQTTGRVDSQNKEYDNG